MTSLHANHTSNTSVVAGKADVRLVTEVVTTREELDRIAGDWNELLRDSKADTIFLTWEWVSTWLDTVYPDARLFVVAVRDGDGRLIAIAPFYRGDLRLLGLVKYKCLRIIGDCQSGAEYADVIIRRSFEKQAMNVVIEELLSHQDVWDCMWFPNVANWTGADHRVADSLGWHFHVHRRQVVFSALELPEMYEEYLSLLARRHRSNIRRHEKGLCAAHKVELQRCQNESQLPEFIDALFLLHGKRWQSVGQTGSFVRRPPMERFYESFAPKALRKGWLRLYVLKVDGVTKAAQYGYAYGDVYYSVQEGYDPESFNGIGNILRNRVFKACIKGGLQEYDFLGGFTDHKRHWGAKQRYGKDIFIGKKSLKNSLLFWKNIWPTGRFIQEGRPANEGRSHD